MTVMLEVAIGLVFVYLVLSLLASSISEVLEHYLRYRAAYLQQGIEKLLLGGDAGLREKLYAHPLIKSLYTSSRLEGAGRAGGPSYIPSRQFVLALLDLVTKDQPPDAAAPNSPVAQLKAALATNKAIPASLTDALRTLINDAGDDIEKVKANVQQWFDGSMDRVAGWYKRRAQFVLLIVGGLTAVLVNVDTLVIVRTLSNDSAVRQAVVTAADTYVRTNPNGPAPNAAPPTAKTLDEVTTQVRNSVETVSKQLGTLGLPIGWRQIDLRTDKTYNDLAATPADQSRYLLESRVWPTDGGQWRAQIFTHLLGWLLTAFAISFGAPFWFDTLNKIMVIRSTVKPREKSREEGSEDRQQPAK